MSMNRDRLATSGKWLKNLQWVLRRDNVYGILCIHGVRGAESPGLSAGVFHHLLLRNLQCLWAINTTSLVYGNPGIRYACLCLIPGKNSSWLYAALLFLRKGGRFLSFPGKSARCGQAFIGTGTPTADRGAWQHIMPLPTIPWFRRFRIHNAYTRSIPR